MGLRELIPVVGPVVGAIIMAIATFVALKRSHLQRLKEAEYAHKLRTGTKGPDEPILVGPGGHPIRDSQATPDKHGPLRPGVFRLPVNITSALAIITLALIAVSFWQWRALQQRSDLAVRQVARALGLFENRCLPGRLEGPGDLTGFPGDLSVWVERIVPLGDPIAQATKQLASKDLVGTRQYIASLTSSSDLIRFNLLMIDARACIYAGDFASATSRLRQANLIRPNDLTCLNHLVNALLLTSAPKEALSYAQQAERQSALVYGADSLDHVKALSNLASVYRDSSDIARAVGLYRQCLAILEHIKPRPVLAIAALALNQAITDLRLSTPDTTAALERAAMCIDTYERFGETTSYVYIHSIDTLAVATAMSSPAGGRDLNDKAAGFLQDHVSAIDCQRDVNPRLYANIYAHWAAFELKSTPPSFTAAIAKAGRAIEVLTFVEGNDADRASALNTRGLAELAQGRQRAAQLDLEAAARERLALDDGKLSPAACGYLLDQALSLVGDNNAKAHTIAKKVRDFVYKIRKDSQLVLRAQSIMKSASAASATSS
jgi:tetratricopeptide (TPR) repeat protein